MKVVPKWATVTVIEPDGRRYSIDVQADSSYDAAHQFVLQAKTQQVGVSPNHLLWTLEGLVEGKVFNRIVVDEPQKSFAKLALDRMLEEV